MASPRSGQRPGRPRDSSASKTTGGTNRLPRSMGTVLAAIRVASQNPAPSQQAFFDVLANVPSPFPMPSSTEHSVSRWEQGVGNLPFGAEHRYATLSKTPTGVLQIASLFYKHLRDASDKSRTSTERMNEYFAALSETSRLKAFVSTAEMLVRQEILAAAAHTEGRETISDAASFEFVEQLLDGYRKAPSPKA